MSAYGVRQIVQTGFSEACATTSNGCSTDPNPNAHWDGFIDSLPPAQKGGGA